MDLASELLHELKKESRRRFILLLICIALLFITNLAWLIAWNLPSEVTTEDYTLEGEDNANVIYSSGEGDVKIGENQSE